MATSPRLSFKGYSFLEALNRNKDLLKGVIVLITGYSYFTGFNLKTFLLSLGAAVAVLIGKLILDAFDFFFSEVQVPDKV